MTVRGMTSTRGLIGLGVAMLLLAGCTGESIPVIMMRQLRRPRQCHQARQARQAKLPLTSPPPLAQGSQGQTAR